MSRQDALIAVDFGAESARVMAVTQQDERLVEQEIHRFATKSTQRADGVQCWDLGYLLHETERGLAALAGRSDLHPVSIGVDTWGVDFALCPREGLPAPDAWPACYRDPRNEAAMKAVLARMDPREIYRRTGIQFLPFNTLYQLEASLNADGRRVEAEDLQLRFMPDLLHHHLCASTVSEYSIATTSQLYNPQQRRWDDALLALVEAPAELMQTLVMPGETLGVLRPSLQRRLGLGAVPMTAVATHDTGSAFAAAPVRVDNVAIISSGTWSLVGVERNQPVMNDAAFAANLTNEGSADGGIRLLKNVMGLWLVQQWRKHSWPDDPPEYESLMALTDEAQPLQTLFDPNDASLLNPADMPQAIARLAARQGQPVPQSKAAMLRAVLENLALAYRRVIDELNTVLDEPIRQLHIIGGGSRNTRLNQWTANATGLPVVAGPIEATALGNAMVQAVAAGWVPDLATARKTLMDEASLTRYEPKDRDRWSDAYARFQALPATPN